MVVAHSSFKASTVSNHDLGDLQLEAGPPPFIDPETGYVDEGQIRKTDLNLVSPHLNYSQSLYDGSYLIYLFC